MANAYDEKSRFDKVRENLGMVFPGNRDKYKEQIRTNFYKVIPIYFVC